MNYKIKSILFAFLISLIGTNDLIAQKDQIPLGQQLESHSERMLIKVGMISKDKPAKLKFGNYSTDNRMGPGVSAKNEGSALSENENKALLFSFDLLNKTGGEARVEASSNSNQNYSDAEDGSVDDISVYITTSLDKDDLWILLMSKNPGTQEFSLKDVFLTNGNEEIVFRNVIGEPTGKSEVTAPKGIEAFIEGSTVGALQYYSGGAFSYKKFIWISEQSEQQLQLVLAGVFSAMMEIGDYFEESSFID